MWDTFFVYFVWVSDVVLSQKRILGKFCPPFVCLFILSGISEVVLGQKCLLEIVVLFPICLFILFGCQKLICDHSVTQLFAL